MSESEKVFQVIIVGAGIAGLSAANFLQQNGVKDILILEAKSQPGGRIRTESVPNSGGIIELGAQWIHGEENPLCELVKTSGHIHSETSWEGKGDFLLPSREKAEATLVKEVLDWIECTINFVEENFSIQKLQGSPEEFAEPRLSSMGSFLRDRFESYLKEKGVERESPDYFLRESVFQWGMSFQRIDNSCNQMKDLSLFRWSEFQVNPGEHYNNFKNGASAFVNEVMVGKLSSPTEILLCDSPVENINWNEGKEAEITVKLRDGRCFYGKCALVTCSIGVLKANLDTLFTPKLPTSLRNAINSTGFGPIGKIFLTWDKPWWPSGLQGFQFLWPKEFINCCDEDYDQDQQQVKDRWIKAITGFDPVLGCPSTLLAWLGGPESIFVEKLKDEEVGEKCVEILGQFTGLKVPQPKKVFVTKWNCDEFVRGAYCYRSTDGDKISGDLTEILCKPVTVFDASGQEKPVIFLAGEALSKAHYSTVHGAYESGEAQAAKIVEALKAETAQPLIRPLPFSETIQKDSKSEIQHLQQLACQFSQQVGIQL